eukprot:TRINITY_DN6122_c0_g1_i1.p1 TRINITY_DN6122_c0_g1~~TRINITY_DN6122_c0_g1_i1.p1  ORF type:complete len:186 (+),score=48.77 TRINITY_DN6122_c0_g1_i1:57-560(+)
MSGAGRKHRAKHLCQTHNSDRYTMEEDEFVVRLVDMRGNHYQVEDAEGNLLLVRLPAKFNKVVWIKRGDLIVVAKECDEEAGVCGVINHRLSEKQVKQFMKEGNLPKRFTENQQQQQSPPENEKIEEEESEEEESQEEDPWLRGNPNVAPTFDDDQDEEEEEEEEEK